MNIELNKYLGLWYELAHSPTFFQTSTDFNTRANYKLLKNGQISVKNTTIRRGQLETIRGTATYLGGNKFHVAFPNQPFSEQRNIPNYIIEKIWTQRNEYFAAIVTNADRSYYSILCRTPRISIPAFNKIQAYIFENFPSLNMVQVPHYENR